MEALVAVGFAANILQFVDYICHVLKIGNQLRRHGMTDSNLDFERSAKLLAHQVARIRSQQGVETGLEEADQALDKLAEECMVIAKELIDFVERFKIERDLDQAPADVPIPKRRSKHQDEIDLEILIKPMGAQIKELEKAIQERKERDKKRDEEKQKEERKKRAEDKNAKRMENTNLVAKLTEAKNGTKHLGDGGLDTIDLDELTDFRPKQGEDLTKTSITRGGGDIQADEIRKTKPVQIIQKKKKPQDEEQLEKLLKLKVERTDQLKKIQQREDQVFQNKQTSAKKANKKAERRLGVRKSIKTLAKAIEFEWNKHKIEDLAHKLDQIRNLLYSEVMLNIQKSVKDIKDSSDHTGKLLENLSTIHNQCRETSQKALQDDQHAVETMLEAQSAQFLLMNNTATQRHDAVIQAINSFTDVLKSPMLFPTLPDILTEADPSLKSAALNGYDAIENAVLAALYFRRMEIREAQVQEANKDTCSWIFEDPEEHQKPWSNFVRWLREETGCYWIEGKAGCGKSTLMKFLRSDARTLNALKEWTGSDELITASYFFWMAGTALQKNQEGLLRSLLHTILTRRRDLIARVFPRQYNAMMTKLFANNSSPDIFFSCGSPGCASSFEQPKQLQEHQRQHHGATVHASQHDNDECGLLTVSELKKAFTTLAKQNVKGFKICLFIDGLDEYVGDQFEIVDLFKTITTNSFMIKAVISSRPEPTFVEAFHDSPSLRVEDLTSGDIDHYVQSKLLAHSKMQNHRRQGSELGAKLTHSIASKACGVFLWVFLVVRSLLECLSDGSYPEDLERIIETYPEELHELYQHMFKRMKPSHRDEAFRLFQAIHHAQSVESKIPTALRLSFLERDQPDHSINSPLEILSAEELQDRLSSFEARLRSRCCGLFEVQYFDGLSPQDVSHIREGRVTFLHRTVSDLLNEPGVRQVIERETLPFKAEIYERLSASILYSFKTWRFFSIKGVREWKAFIGEIKAFFVYCQRCEQELGSKQIKYIEELDRRLTYFWQVRALETRSKAHGAALGNYEYHWAESLLDELHLKLTAEPDLDPLLSLAARYGLCKHVCQKLQTRPLSGSDSLEAGGKSMIIRLSYWAIHHSSLREQHFEIIHSLLVSGFKVNARSSRSANVWERTPWQEILSLQSKSLPTQASRLTAATKVDEAGRPETEASEVDKLDVWIQLVDLFLKFGAELDVNFKPFRGAKGDKTAREVILEAISTLETGQCLSFEESKIMQSKLHIQQLLAEHSSLEQSGNPSITLTSPNNSLNGDVPVSFRYRKTRLWTRRKAAIQPEEPVEPASLPSVVSKIDKPCYRCKAVEELADIGFATREVLDAMKYAGVGYDVPALTTWILDRKCDDDEDIPRSSPTAPPRPLQAAESKVPRPVSTKSPGSMMKQWSVVAKKSKPPSQQDEIVGAQWILKPQKVKCHSPKTKSVAREANTEQGSVAGAIEVDGGTLTWFFEANGRAQSSVSLSVEQAKRLEEFVKSMGG